MELYIQSEVELCSQPCTYACKQACKDFKMESCTHPNMEQARRLPSREGKCPNGFSILQIAILSVLKSHAEVIAYWQIAELIASHFQCNITEGAVRGALERLYRHGFLLRQRGTSGHLKGNRYAFNSEPCAHIMPLYEIKKNNVESGTHSGTFENKHSAPSILNKIDRKNLSISSNSMDGDNGDRERLEAFSEEDIAFNWPELAQIGFGTIQIRQIVEVRGKEQDGLKNIMQGLTYADWEFAHHGLRTKKGEEIKSPLNWIFSIFLRQGYYPRPPGYISPEEQADLDRTTELAKQQEARKARLEAEYEEWFANCTIDERKSISSRIELPEKAALRMHFVENIWPKILCESRQGQQDREEGG